MEGLKMMQPEITAFFDHATFTVTYIVSDPKERRCAIIDSVLDYDPKSGRTSTLGADQLIDFVLDNRLSVDWILETHAHADHLTAAPYLKEKLGGQIAIGEHINGVQKVFKKLFNLEASFLADGSQFDRVFGEGDTFRIGNLEARVLHTPGHTPACVAYLVGDAAFVGDTLFMPDYGTARCDFPGGDAGTLYRSVQRLFELPQQTRLFLCHDYGAPGREEFAWETTVAEQRAKNIQIHEGIDEAKFVQMRVERDATLAMPTLILPAIQVNIRAGHLPPSEDNGVSYLKIPIDAV